MLKSTVKSIGISLTSLAVVLSVCQSANAQLNVGRRKIQRGLEREYLQYQLENRNLSDAFVIPSCTVGSGTGCNKTGTVLQQLLAINGGPSYYDLVIRAAGGQQNYQNFAAFYGNNERLPEIPFASFWKRQSPSIVDGYQYVLGQPVSRSPVAGLGAVTKNFAWSPISRGDNSLSPRQGLLDFKYSVGHELLVEVSKIPNLRQQIRDLDLPPEMTQFYLNNLSQGLNALKTGNEEALQENILRIFSFPYSSDSTTSPNYGRVSLDTPKELDNIAGIPIAGAEIIPDIALLEPESFSLDLGTDLALDVGTITGSAFNPFYLSPLALLPLLFLFGGGDGDSSSPPVTIPPVVPSVPPVINPTPTPTPTTPPPPVKVDEPSTLTAILLLTPLLGVLSYKKRMTRTKTCVKS
ncbi:hypothetical protein H6G74_18085 [Nostoc spongiaeforme FACHB-130]|uniref:PEP-CTERM sorting domain-containing protein n=1 Tax=Nostoc spongiaeforme FACHB-130 TaxID=1357510 RepID=A0ABR8FYI7_9NOSO|nr:hypothetical protein [Nostoc spongiaeforme]MBD2596222.1 hypothetical protein [Nostoc spongiaeforme FACHB-130]